MNHNNTNIYDLIFGVSRREEITEATDGLGVSRQFVHQIEVTGIDRQGQALTLMARKVTPMDCGHSPDVALPAGKCGICSGWSCTSCFSRCAKCAVPLCPAHTRRFEGNAFCEECVAKEKMKSRLRKMCNFLTRRKGE